MNSKQMNLWKTSSIWLRNDNCTKHAVLVVNTNTSFNTRYHCEIPQDRFQQRRYAAILQKRWGREDFNSDSIQKGSEGKESKDLTVSQWAVEYLKSLTDSHLQMLYTVRCVKECVCVCVCMCMKACVMDLSLHAAFLLQGFFHFRSPSSPWMVFLMRSRRVVCHWSRREMESKSLTCRWERGTEISLFSPLQNED